MSGREDWKCRREEGRERGRKEGGREGRKEERERTNSFSHRRSCSARASSQHSLSPPTPRALTLPSTRQAHTRRGVITGGQSESRGTRAGGERRAEHRPAHRGPWREQGTARTRRTGASSPRSTTAAPASAGTSPTAATLRASPRRDATGTPAARRTTPTRSSSRLSSPLCTP